MRRRLAALGVVTLALAGAGPAAAEDVVVPTATEAWYATLPSLVPRPGGTLHVGTTAGFEDSRTYLSLDLVGLPSNAELVAGTLTLPIDTADSEAPETAVIDVCAAEDPGPAVEGSTDPPPAVDCERSVRAVLAGGAFTADLAPFLPDLRSGGLALVPVPEGAASWHVAFWSRGSDAADAVPISATLTTADDADDGAAPAPPRPPASTVEDDEVAVGAFGGAGTGFANPAAPELAPGPVAAPEVPTTPSLGAARLPLPPTATPYADSLVFTLPLVLLALVGYFGRALTRPVDLPARDVTPAEGLRARRRAPLRARVAREHRASG